MFLIVRFYCSAAMDLFSFIYNVDPTKVRVGEIEKAGDQVLLLEATRGRVVPLAPPVSVTAASSEGNMTENIDRLFDKGNGAEKEHSTMVGEYVALTEAIVEPVNKDVAEKPKRLKKKKKPEMLVSLLDSSKLAAEIRVAAVVIVPLVTSYVTPTPKHEGGDHTDSISGPNLQTKPAAVRFIISSDLSNHFDTHALDVDVSSLVRSTVPDSPVMTATVTTTAVVETSLVSVSKATAKPVNPTLFGDSMSTSGHDVAGPSSPVHPDLSADSFYAVQDLNPKTLHRVYVSKWNVTNESILDDPYMCRTLTDHLASLSLFSQLRAMKYDQLYTEFNVGVARQTFIGAEVAEAIRLRGHVATVEATEALHVVELNLLKERNCALEARIRASEEKAASLESEKSSLTDQVSSLETTCVELCNQVAGYELFKEQIKAVQDEQVKVLIEKIMEVDANLIGMDLQFDDEFYPSYLTTITGRRVSALRDVDFSLLDLLVSQKDASIADIMYSLRPEDNVVLGGNFSIFFLGKPLSSENLLGAASTSGVLVSADAVTTLSTTFAQYVSVLVPLLLVADYGVVHAGPQVEDPSSGEIVFKKEELELLLNLLRVVKPAIMAVLPIISCTWTFISFCTL
ncbi:hypothetical protein Tco_0172690 [Tanacetum coccineum]